MSSRIAASPWRGWLLVLAILIVLACVLPPLAVLAREHVSIEALQFALLGYGVPPLIVIGLPPASRGRLAGTSSSPRSLARASRVAGPGRRSPVRRPRTAVSLVAFVVIALVWRTPPAVNALHGHSWLALLEACSLIVAGVALWIELVDDSDATAVVSGPMRMASATVAMWSIWIAAYLLGFASVAWYRSFHHGAGGMSVSADQEIACGILWAIPGIVFIPVVFAQLTSWLRREELAPEDPRGRRSGGPIRRPLEGPT